MAKVNMGLQVLPYVSEEKLYSVVDKVIDYIDTCQVKYQVGPMETTLEGELDDLLEIVKKVQEICTNAGASRVVSIIKIDFKKTGVSMDEKVEKYQK